MYECAISQFLKDLKVLSQCPLRLIYIRFSPFQNLPQEYRQGTQEGNRRKPLGTDPKATCYEIFHDAKFATPKMSHASLTFV